MNANIDFDTLTENVLVVFFIVTSAYAYIEAESFSGQVAQFPQLMAGIIFIGSVLLLFRNYLPGPLRAFVAESTSLINETTPDIEDHEQSPVDDEKVATPSENTGMISSGPSDKGSSYDTIKNKLRNDQAIHDMLSISVGIIAYVILSYLIGILFASPLFILAYGFWFGVSKKIIVFLAAMSVVVAWSFVSFLYIPLNEGILIESVF